MSSYPEDTTHLDALPAHQRALGMGLLAESAQTGESFAVLLADADAPAEDKAALEQARK